MEINGSIISNPFQQILEGGSLCGKANNVVNTNKTRPSWFQHSENALCFSMDECFPLRADYFRRAGKDCLFRNSVVDVKRDRSPTHLIYIKLELLLKWSVEIIHLK